MRQRWNWVSIFLFILAYCLYVFFAILVLSLKKNSTLILSLGWMVSVGGLSYLINLENDDENE